MSRYPIRLCSLALALAALGSSTAIAFNTAAHYDMSGDVMRAEGFGDTAIQVVQVSNWFNDLYEQDTANSYSGHVSWFSSFGDFIGNFLTLFRKENWPQSIVDAAEHLHFDSTDPIDTTAQAEAEWIRLSRATRSLLRQYAASRDAEGILCVMGMSLHAVQDFYSHTNWVEPQGSRPRDGFAGPGWTKIASFGTFPTWFDVPASERAKFNIYSQVPNANPVVTHGAWDQEAGGTTKPLAMQKDSAGRRFYREAYLTAHIATRQWIRAMRTWMADETMWRAAQGFRTTKTAELAHDQNGTILLSWLAGNWNGNTGKRAPKLEIAAGGIHYFEGRGRTSFRKKWEDTIRQMAVRNPALGETPVASSNMFAGTTEYVEMVVEQIAQIDDIDGGDIPLVGENDADWYTRARIGGQGFISCLINGTNTFNLQKPYGSLRFYKSVPKGPRTFEQPLYSLKVRLRTGTGDGAGSDMDLYLQLGSNQRLEFPYGDFDDFERGRNDLYTFPVPNGVGMRELSNLSLVKGGGGGGHAWQMGGIQVIANNVVIYQNDGINRWFDKRDETFALPGYRVPEWSTRDVPIAYELWDDDIGLTFSDDQADICPAKGSQVLRLLYNTDTMKFTGDHSGFGTTTVRGAGDDDRAQIAFRITTFRPVPPPGRFIKPGIRDSILRPPGGAATVKPPVGGSRVGGALGGTLRKPKPSTKPPVKPPPPLIHDSIRP